MKYGDFKIFFIFFVPKLASLALYTDEIVNDMRLLWRND